MEKLRYVAFISIARGVGFSGLAIFTLMVGLSYQPVLALRSGGVLLLILIAGLLLKAQRAPQMDHRDTEAWLLLDRSERPADSVARRAIAGALREACLWFARWIACVTAIIWMFAITFSWFGLDSDLDAAM